MSVETVVEIIDEPREFALHELFFSTTDRKGRIQRANGVFQRIAGYSWDELENKPHNIIRHPEMPRVVFQILWDRIQAGQPVVAFVKNLAHDCRYYWVVALVSPMPEGYVSVRFKPSSPLLATVQHLYTELKAIEIAVESEADDRKAAIAASRAALDTSLQNLGFSGYEDFMQESLKQEMQSRAKGLAAPLAIAAGPEAASPSFDSGGTAAEMFDQLLKVLDVLFGDLEAYVNINRDVRTKSENVNDISEALRVSALNGVIAVDKLGTRAAGLRPVLNWLRLISGEITREGVRLAASLKELVNNVDRVVFGLSAAKLQIEMTAQFAHESAASDSLGGSGKRMREGAIAILHASASETARRALSGLADIRDRLKTLAESQMKLLETSHSLRPVYLTGRIEMAEGAGPRLATVFKDVGDQLEETAANLNGLRVVLENLEAHLARGLAHGDRVEEMIALVDSRMATT
jgi:aerotaxis receptor